MIKIDSSYYQTVDAILKRRLIGREVRAFGSRVSGTPKSYSDLDLVVMGLDKLPMPVLYGLRDDFEESDLPFRVDILDWNRLSSELKTSILPCSEIFAAYH